MVQIKIGFSKPKKWKPFAWLIMTGYGIPYDHVFLELYSPKYDRKMIYQASGARVNFMGHDLFTEENEILASYDIELADEQYTKMMQFAIDNAGRSYGIKQAAGMAIVRIAELFGKKITNPYRDGAKTFVCSELGAYVLEQYADYHFAKDTDDLTPKDLYISLQLALETKKNG